MPDESFVPHQDRLAYHLLKSNGFAPPFIEERALLLADYAALCHARDALLQRWPHLTPPRQAEIIQQLTDQFTALWRRILDFNLQAPSAYK
jgi:hypothetical protein